MPKRNDPAAGGAAERADIGDAGRHSDTTLRTAAVDLSEIRFARAVARLHRLGPRPFYELLVELAAARLLRTEIEEIVGRYLSRLEAGVLGGLGTNRLPPHPIHIVQRADG